MKKLFKYLGFLLMGLFLFVHLALLSPMDWWSQPTRKVKNRSFEHGEVLNYKVHYGLYKAGEAEMIIDEKVHRFNNRPCYKIDVFGKTTGSLDWIIRIRDNWGTYLDTAAIVPHRFYRHIEEGNYRKHEIVTFDQPGGKAHVKRYDKENKNIKEDTVIRIPSNVQDLVSGYYFLRTVDFSKSAIGDTLRVTGFFDDEIFELKVRYQGKSVLKTKLGKIESLVLTPVMPENKLFRGDDAIQLWLSDDLNRIPLKIKAAMFVGSVELDITEVQGLKNPLKIQ